MLLYISALLCLILAITTFTVLRGYELWPPAEVRRQAKRGDTLAQKLYQVTRHGREYRTVLIFVIIMATAGSFALFSIVAPPLLCFGLFVVILAGSIFWPPERAVPFFIRLTELLTPAVSWLLTTLHPLIYHLGHRDKVARHTGLYEREDVLALFEQQRAQADNRIDPTDLQAITQMTRLSDRLVREIVIPRKAVMAVAASEQVGPILLDELHASGHHRFLVYDGKRDHVVGLLALEDVVSHAKAGGPITHLVDPRLCYVHEADSVRHVLDVFYRSKQPLMIVINSFDEYVGIVTIEDVVRELLGKPEPELTATHFDRAAVVARHAQSKPE